MGFWEQLPYTNFHELNLTEIIKKLNMLQHEMRDFKAVNEIVYRGHFDITKSYKPWSVVTESDCGYVSIRPVPAGIPLDNISYWVKIADFTALYADLSEKIIELEQDYIDTNNALNSFKNSYINESRYSRRKVICISDSYGLVPDVNTSWIPNLKWYLNIPDSNFWSNSYNGSGFHGTQPDHKFEDLFNEVITSWTTEQKEQLTDIVIVGGYNDSNSLHYGATTAQIKTDMASCLRAMRTACPNAQIWVSMPAWDNNASSWHETLRVVEHLYQQGMNYTNRVTYIDGNYWLHRSALCASDGLHPTSTGSTAIAETIASCIMGGSAFCDMAVNEVNGMITPTFSAYGTDVSNVVITSPQMHFRGGTCYFDFQRINFDLDTDIATQYAVEIGTFNDTIMTGGDALATAYKQPCRVINNSHYADCELLIYNKKLYLLNLSGSNLDTGTIQIACDCISGDVML